MNDIVFIITAALMYSAPLIFAAEGGVLSERSGIVNIGLEGMMCAGAAFAVIGSFWTGSPWIGLLCAGIVGGALARLHAFACVKCGADQTVSGVAMNMLGSGGAFFAARYVFDTLNTPPVNALPKLFGAELCAWAALLLAWAVHVFLNMTHWGFRVRAVGEHSRAAETMGIDTDAYRTACVTASGVLAGMGGAAVSIGIISNFQPTTISGQGFIALAAVILGRRQPLGTCCACLLFGSAQAFAVRIGASESIPSQFIAMIPYVLTLIVLLLQGRSPVPSATSRAKSKAG